MTGNRIGARCGQWAGSPCQISSRPATRQESGSAPQSAIVAEAPPAASATVSEECGMAPDAAPQNSAGWRRRSDCTSASVFRSSISPRSAIPARSPSAVSTTTMFSCSSARPPPSPTRSAGPEGREEQVQPLGRDPGHGPGRRDRLEVAQHEPGLLLGLAPGAGLGIVLVEAAGRRLEERVRARDMEHRGAELAHQDGGTALGIVGQDRDRRAVVLDLARHRMPVGELDRELQELPPALVQRLDGRDAMLLHPFFPPIRQRYLTLPHPDLHGPPAARNRRGAPKRYRSATARAFRCVTTS